MCLPSPGVRSNAQNMSLRVNCDLPMARSSIVPRPAVAIVAQAAGDRLPSYVTREQARA